MPFNAFPDPHHADPHHAGASTDAYAQAGIQRLLVENLVREGMQDLDAPHLVVCTDLEDGTVSFQGPYPDAFTALIAAETEAGQLVPDLLSLRFSVAPVLPPLPLD